MRATVTALPGRRLGATARRLRAKRTPRRGFATITSLCKNRRWSNFIPSTAFPYRPYGSKALAYDSGNYQGCLDKALVAFDYASRRSEQDRLRHAGRYRGIGVAAYTEICGMALSRRLAIIGFDRGGWESARVVVDSAGKVTIYSGSMSQGHGHATVMAQIAADVLQMPPGNIDVVQGDTKQVQAGHGTFNSRSMPVGGSSVNVCAGRIIVKAKKIAAGMMEVDDQDVAYEDGKFVVPGTDIAPPRLTAGAMS